MIVFLYIAFLIYFLAMLWIAIGFLLLPNYKTSNNRSTTPFSIVIPFRNEAENLPKLLESINNQHYPIALYELLFVDDASEDDSVKLLERWKKEVSISCRIIQNKRSSASPKKDAITLAIKEAKYAWILTTDADCQLPRSWLRYYDQIIQHKNPKMVCGPVIYPSETNALGSFQFLDGLSLQAAAMGSFGWRRPMLCNGANMGYLKSAFMEVSGFEGNDHIASGDDIFLLEKMIKEFPKQVHFLKSNQATVHTQSETSWKAIIAQRIRWASKTTRTQSWGTKLLGGIVFMGNLAFLVAPFALFMDLTTLDYIVLFGSKITIDLFLLLLVGSFFQKWPLNERYPINVIAYPIISIRVVLQSLFGGYQWKGRSFKK